uniref:Putative secreted peptide n=1 Tax=Anopheles braziliensis TaxID=58242 RepID=A0A2M3ZP78_9DIPT
MNRGRYWWAYLTNSFAIMAITSVDSRMCTDACDRVPVFPRPDFRGTASPVRLAQGVSRRTNLNSDSTRLAGVDSLQPSSAKTMQFCRVVISSHCFLPITSFGTPPGEDEGVLSSVRYPESVPLIQSTRASF